MSSGFHYKEYSCNNIALINEFITQFPLAIIVSQYGDESFSSHIPLFCNDTHKDIPYFGHVDKRNPQFSQGLIKNAKIIFIGHQCYIPPAAYVSSQLPTWNYTSVHIDADIEIVENQKENYDILQKTIHRVQPESTHQDYTMDNPAVKRFLPLILGLHIKVNAIEGRFKLSQDKAVEDQEAALDWLHNSMKQIDTPFLQRLMNFDK